MKPRRMAVVTNTVHTVGSFVCYVMETFWSCFLLCLTFRHRASCILGQAFHYSPENAFYIFNQIYFII